MTKETISGQEMFRDLLRKIPAIERWEPVEKELAWVLQGKPNSAEHKQLLPDYCYQILVVWRRSLFKDLPTSASIVSCREEGAAGAKPSEGTKPVVQLNWRLYGRVAGLGSRCSRFWELEAEDLMEREGLSDIKPDEDTEIAGMLAKENWLKEREAEMAGANPGVPVEELPDKILGAFGGGGCFFGVSGIAEGVEVVRPGGNQGPSLDRFSPLVPISGGLSGIGAIKWGFRGSLGGVGVAVDRGPVGKCGMGWCDGRLSGCIARADEWGAGEQTRQKTRQRARRAGRV